MWCRHVQWYLHFCFVSYYLSFVFILLIGDEVAIKAKDRCISRISNHQIRKQRLSNGNYDCIEVHLGCSFHDILKAEGNIISGGICTLIVFARNNGAHKKFLKENNIRPNFVLMPTPS